MSNQTDFGSRRALLGAFAAVVVASNVRADGSDGPQDAARAAARVVVLLRHAEAAGGHGGDPALTEAGERRATELARLFGAAAPALFVASEYRRTKDTLAPLARACGGEVVELSARDPRVWIERVDALAPGSLAILCGHSNTVPDLAKRLGVELADLEDGPAGRQFASAEHGRIVVVVRPGGAPAHAFELRY